MIDTLLYLVARTVIAIIQALPLRVVARVGRVGGALAYWLDARHRKVAIKNLTMCFGGEKSENEIRAIAKENFRRLGESYACAIKTSGMTKEQLHAHYEVIGVETIMAVAKSRNAASVIVAVGHFGNFELYARFADGLKPYEPATTYRSLPQPSLNRLMQSLRERSGCLFFERRSQFRELRNALAEKRMILGLLADQHAGDGAVRLPFFGHECSTTSAPAVLALRYNAPLFTAICFRTGLAQWRIETGLEIRTHDETGPRSTEAIMNDVNQAFEAAIRREPANWFWVHNRWKPPRTKIRRQKKSETARSAAIQVM